MRTPRTLSPYMLIQEFLRDEPWKLLVACILLNQTRARQVHSIINDLFERYPDPHVMAEADEIELAAILRPTGFHNTKAKRIKRMSAAYIGSLWTKPEDLPSVGKYAADSFKIFCSGYIVDDVLDKELKNYVQWAQEG